VEIKQILINIMYLVLVALLFLNVSAEIYNAFFSSDHVQKESQLIQTSYENFQLHMSLTGLTYELKDSTSMRVEYLITLPER